LQSHRGCHRSPIAVSPQSHRSPIGSPIGVCHRGCIGTAISAVTPPFGLQPAGLLLVRVMLQKGNMRRQRQFSQRSTTKERTYFYLCFKSALLLSFVFVVDIWAVWWFSN
jgi:hypothetical protein